MSHITCDVCEEIIGEHAPGRSYVMALCSPECAAIRTAIEPDNLDAAQSEVRVLERVNERHINDAMAKNARIAALSSVASAVVDNWDRDLVFEHFEATADAYYRETGHMAPGKDRPAAFGEESREQADLNRRRWGSFCAARDKALIDRARLVIGAGEHNTCTKCGDPLCPGVGPCTGWRK